MFKKYNFKDYRFRLIIYVVLLSVIGVIFIGSANPDYQMRQLLGVIAGCVLMLLISCVDYRFITQFYRIFYLLTVVLLILVLVVGKETNGATRWIDLGPFAFQPSDLAKLFLILYFSMYFFKYREKLNTAKTIVPALILFSIPAFLIFREPNLSTTIIMTMIFITLLFIAGLSYKIIGTVLAIGIPSAIVVMVLLMKQLIPLKQYQYSRIMSWIDPVTYSDDSFQQQYSMKAIGSGQLFGKGLNNNSFTSVKNGNFISEPQTDFIFAIIGEELGFVGSVVVIGLILLIVLECVMVARKAKDIPGRLICCGIATWIGFQGFVNLCVASGMMPNTGVTLPFVSYGLTSLLSLYLGIGIVLNIGLQGKKHHIGDEEDEYSFRRS